MRSGILGYHRKLDRAVKEDRGIHRRGSSTLKSRFKKKILQKTDWYRTKPPEDEQESRDGKAKTNTTRRPRTVCKGQDPSSVLFIERTGGGKLAADLRHADRELMTTIGDFTKIVEKAGTPLGNLLVKKDPWGDSGCGKEQCKVCGGTEEKARWRSR